MPKKRLTNLFKKFVSKNIGNTCLTPTVSEFAILNNAKSKTEN